MLEKILNRPNIERAIRAVERNHGAGGVDDRQSDELRHLDTPRKKAAVRIAFQRAS